MSEEKTVQDKGEPRKITTVILWTNGQCSVHDQDGQHMPEYRGHYGEVKDKILQDFHREWQIAEWDKGVLATFHPNVYLPLKGVTP